MPRACLARYSFANFLSFVRSFPTAQHSTTHMYRFTCTTCRCRLVQASSAHQAAPLRPPHRARTGAIMAAAGGPSSSPAGGPSSSAPSWPQQAPPHRAPFSPSFLNPNQNDGGRLIERREHLWAIGRKAPRAPCPQRQALRSESSSDRHEERQANIQSRTETDRQTHTRTHSLQTACRQ